MRARARAGVVALALGVVLSPALVERCAFADPPTEARAHARGLFDEAERAAADRRFADALRAYRGAYDADPSAPFAPAARARADDLAAHAEGGFEPLRRLEEVRRDPALARDPAAIEALDRDVAAFPPGRVRSEARLVVAESYWHAMEDPRRAVAPLEAVLTDPAADRLTRSVALGELAAVDRALGDLDSAVAAADRDPELAPALRTELHRLARRVRIRWAALVLLGVLGAIGAMSFSRIALRRGARALPAAVVRPLAVAFALYLGAGGAILVRVYGTDDPRPFLWLGFGVLAIDIVARAWRSAATDRGRAARFGRVVLCAVGVLAVAFLALERTQAGYLEGFGL